MTSMTRRSRRHRLGALGLLVLGAGCAVGPDFNRPAAPADAGYSPAPMPATTAAAPGAPAGEAQALVISDDLPWKWWTYYESDSLNRLVERAFAHSPSIEAAHAALRQANEYVLAQRGYFFPTVSAGYTFERQKLAGNLGGNSPGIQGNGTTIATGSNPNGPPYNAPVTYNFHTAQLSVAYVPDVFGANRRAAESLTAQADVQRFQLEAAYLSLATNVVAAAIQEASVRAQLEAATQSVAANKAALDILKNQLKFGYVTRADVAAQETALAQAIALVPPLERQLAQTEDLLRALVGTLPDEDLGVHFTLDSLTLPKEIPVSVPASLVRHRPDVAAAEATLHAATADVGVATAARIPQISLTGNLGGTASTFSDMFKTGGPFWNGSASIAQVLFDAGTLRHRQRAAEQALVQAGAQYRATVISAAQNVADALHAVETDAAAYAAAVDAERAATTSLQVATDQRRLGLVSPLVLLQAQSAYQLALLNRAQAQSARLGDTAGLLMALGGGWWNRAPDELKL